MILKYLLGFFAGVALVTSIALAGDWSYRAQAQPLPKSQPKQEPAPSYPPPAVITPDKMPSTMPQPTTLVVNAAAPATPPEPPAFLVQLLTYGLTALLGALGLSAGAPLVPGLARWSAGKLFDVEEKYRARLKDMIKTALISGAADMPRTPDGSVPADRKTDLLQRVLNYVQTHGLGTLKYLGAKPDTHKATDAILAHAEAFLADPKFPVTISRDIAVAGAAKDDVKQMFEQFVREHFQGGQAGLPKAS